MAKSICTVVKMSKEQMRKGEFPDVITENCFSCLFDENDKKECEKIEKTYPKNDMFIYFFTWSHPCIHSDTTDFTKISVEQAENNLQKLTNA